MRYVSSTGKAQAGTGVPGVSDPTGGTSGSGEECGVKRGNTMGYLARKRQTQKVLCGNAAHAEELAVLKAEALVIVRITDQQTSVRTQLAQRLEAIRYQSRPHALTLTRWGYGNRSESEPLHIGPLNQHKGECDMASHHAIVLSDEGNRQCAGFPQAIDDQMFGLVAERMICECVDIERLNCSVIVGCLRSNEHLGSR